MNRKRSPGRVGARRGAALFVVVLVILALTSVAMFAARSATVDTQAAGRYRQMVQTHQLAQLGLSATMGELSRQPELYLRAMTASNTFGGGPPTCTSTTTSSVDCYRFGYEDLENAVSQARGTPLELVDTMNSSTRTPGGLGLASTHANFAIELVDRNPAPPPPGNAADANLVFYSVAVSARGQVIYRDPADASFRQNITNPHVSSVDEIRGLVTIGPIGKVN